MKYVIANWKMNMNRENVLTWKDGFKSTHTEEVEVIIAPSFPYLETLKNVPAVFAGQDVSIENKGAHTGETGAFMLKDFCKYCIVWHSERKENPETVKIKRDKCLEEGITPIVCFVEPKDSQELYKEGIILAWEDPQNISVDGVYRSKDPGEIRKTITEIRNNLPANSVVIYGGSVNRDNIAGLAQMPGLDGVLVGNASLDPAHFKEIIDSYSI